MRARAVGVEQVEFARQVRQTRQSLDTIDDTSLVDLTHLAPDAVRELAGGVEGDQAGLQVAHRA